MSIKTTLLLLFSCSCISAIAQNANPSLFMDRYDTEKKIMCSDQAWVYEEVNDRKEYELKRKEFHELHKEYNPSTEFVSSKKCIIVYQYQINRSSFNCSPSIYAYKKSTSIENCKNALAVALAKEPKHFKTQPNIVFTWQGKGVEQMETIMEDFGGVSGKFYLIDKSSGGSIVVVN